MGAALKPLRSASTPPLEVRRARESGAELPAARDGPSRRARRCPCDHIVRTMMQPHV